MHLTLALGPGRVLPRQRKPEAFDLYDLALYFLCAAAFVLPLSAASLPVGPTHKVSMLLGCILGAAGWGGPTTSGRDRRSWALVSQSGQEVRLTGMGKFLFFPQSLPPISPWGYNFLTLKGVGDTTWWELPFLP